MVKKKKRTYRKPPNYKLIAFWLVMILTPLFCCNSHILLNKYRLFMFSRQLFAYPLPPETTIISHHTWIDNDGGSQLWCHFGAKMVINTELSAAELSDYYGDVKIRGIDGNVTQRELEGSYDRSVFINHYDHNPNIAELIIYHRYAIANEFPHITCDYHFFDW